MSWGLKIATLYGSFVIMIMTLVVLSAQQDVPLVTEDYYEKDLQYETQMNRIANSKALEEDVKIIYKTDNQSVTIYFPKEITDLKGDVLCFRPSEEGIDFSLPIDNLTNNTMAFGTSEMLKGRWKIKITWEGDGEIFYKETTLDIL